MNTRSKKTHSESGIGESEHPPPGGRGLFHRIYEESPRSPSTAVLTGTPAGTSVGRIPPGRVLERSPVRSTAHPEHPTSQEIPSRSKSPICRPTSPAYSAAPSIRSHRSSVSVAARVRLVEYEAEKELAELEERRIQLKKTLVKKRLEAEISAIEAEEGGETICDQERIHDWVNKSHEHAGAQVHREQEVLPPPLEVRGEERPRQRGRGIEQLANALEKMMHVRPPPRQTSELPAFSGLRGEARETVLSQLYTATHPDSIMKTLEMKYGRPEYIFDKAMEELKRLPKVGNSSSELNELAIKLQNVVYTMKSVDHRGYLRNPLLIRDVMEKLSPHLVSKWAEYAAINEGKIAYSDEITILSEFLMGEADRVLRYTHTARNSTPGLLRGERPVRRTAPREKVYSTSESTREERAPSCLRCQSTSHHTPKCPQLKELTINDRWNWAKEQRGPRGEIRTHALLDEGSTVTLIDEELASHLTSGGPNQPLNIRGINEQRRIDSKAVKIQIKEKINKYDKRASDIFEATARRKDGHFEVGLPWKTDNPTLPDSYEQAYKRLRTLEKKMENEPTFKKEYSAQVANLLKKGYAEACDGNEERSNVKWYLPHFAVVNINKPNKIRMVFDAAAKINGVSLNDYLLEGPDLLASLIKILFGFREKKIAVTADIEEMFLRVKIRSEDQPAQMFLWRDESSEAPRKYKMTSMIFGASSSPYLAHSVRNKNAADYEEGYPEAARAIRERHYMDDYLDSFQSEEEAIKVIRDVIHVHEQASFNLRGWNSNSPAVLASIPDTKKSKNVNVQLTTHQSEKTLGLRWNPSEDTIGFNTDIKRVPTEVKCQQRAPTKREALSAVMSIYDPLGLVSQYTITGKILLQQLWVKKVGWDEELPREEAEEFQQWVAGLQDISNLALPRCYSRDMTPSSELQLHIFNDASEQAYATTAYWRITHKDGTVEVVQVMGKAKVAPLKLLTIPRLELQAALIGARMASTILKEHEWKPGRVYYWTDSKTVLHWIRNDKKKYTPFVAHRLAEIGELSQVEDWRWVPTADNVADDATRIETKRITGADRWFTGPSFLSLPEEEWPTEATSSDTSEEATYTITTDDITDRMGCLPDITRFSAYRRLIRATALVQLYVQKLRTKNRSLLLEVSHIQDAELRWIRQAQQDSFGEDLRRLRAGQHLHRHSKLAKLDPVIEEGTLKARGRIGASKTSTHSNRPVILDGGHPFTRLLVMDYHRNAGHANNERVVNELKATPQTPPRGDLPEERTSPGHRPFNYCGVDYFGPLTVTIGRRHEKRWCALFTCLTTRAVHLELVSSLSTDSAIMALRRMAARRGWPQVIFSDNATNFRGADVELRNAYRAWGPELHNFCLQYGTSWRFIPPGAPHMGGAWERLVRSVKTALSTTLNEKSPKEEVLQTLLVEAEYCVNARPLTHVSVDPADSEALTPNHFLIGSSTGLPLTGPCEEADRSVWRKAQALADQFWGRWVKEYLPTLIPRGQETRASRQLRVGDLVIVVDNTLPRNTWPRGIVERVHEGPDGIVRSADVRTRGGVFRRPVVKLAVLQIGRATTELRRGEDVADGE
ncbi:uncharacterized protein [Epargyreus clarus]|uniref:uncharacterized protein n=1 Tax=Epargyreus clarus TaxID=520877 RepID=UPI003C2BFFB2